MNNKQKVMSNEQEVTSYKPKVMGNKQGAKRTGKQAGCNQQ